MPPSCSGSLLSFVSSACPNSSRERWSGQSHTSQTASLWGNRPLSIPGYPVPTMINNLFRLLFTATLALGAVVAVIGHAVHGGSDAKIVHTVQKVDHPKIMGFDHPKR